MADPLKVMELIFSTGYFLITEMFLGTPFKLLKLLTLTEIN